MEKSTSMKLPYYFRNTGTELATRANILTAGALKLDQIFCPLETKISVHLHYDGQEPVDFQTKLIAASSDELPLELKPILTGEDEKMMLWSIVAGLESIQLYFIDRFCRSKTKKSIDGIIVIERNIPLCLQVSAAEFKKTAARTLHCEYGLDAAWGRTLALAEWRQNGGITRQIHYPDAPRECLQNIINS